MRIMHMNKDNLYAMHNYMRPAWSNAERAFIKRFLYPLPDAKIDELGNVYVRIKGAPDVVWSSHTDTVHSKSGRQTVYEEEGILRAQDPKVSSCLGADCTAGVWLMTEMIEAKVPGLYIFHRGEEQGCVGSKYLLKNYPEVLTGVKFAIAFDRRGYDSVVTHQMGTRCASDEFAQSLIAALGGEVSLPLKPDPTGSYTDTAQYTRVVDECTNLSVGYFGQHSSSEYQDVDHLCDLREQLCSIDTKRLVVARDKTKYESRWGGGSYYGGRGWTGGSRGAYSGGNYRSYAGAKARVVDDQSYRPAIQGRTMYSLVRDYPEETVQLLEQMGYTADQLRKELADQRDLSDLCY